MTLSKDEIETLRASEIASGRIRTLYEVPIKVALDLSTLRSVDGKITAELSGRRIAFRGGSSPHSIAAEPDISDAHRILAHFDGYCEGNDTSRKRDPNEVIRISRLSYSQVEYLRQANLYNSECGNEAVNKRSDDVQIGATYVEASRAALDDLSGQLEMMGSITEEVRDQEEDQLTPLEYRRATYSVQCQEKLSQKLYDRVHSD